LYWKQTGDINVWKGIAQDAIVMNLDDLLCVGIFDNLLFSSAIDRNKNLIPAEVLKVIVEGTQEFFDEMNKLGINISFLGGETADVGDVVRTITVNGTMAARWEKKRLVTNENIKAGNVIVGLASYGKAVYEKEYNSGIGSNGLTSGRHDVLKKKYAAITETFDGALDEEVVYAGKYDLEDELTIKFKGKHFEFNIGKLLLSPTRTFAPLLKEILQTHFDDVYGLIHCSGGGQTKCMKYMPDNVRVVKDNLFAPPEIFQIVQQCSGADDREMYQVFNMGCRMEIYTNELAAEKIIAIAEDFEIDAQVIGRVKEADKSELVIGTNENKIVF
jgi:phosphoribosylformylglycinamidine cyclo-ligase